MKLITNAMLCILSMGLASLSFSSQPNLIVSGISSQLQQPTVSSIHRDRSGILWIGTQQGLYSYDGAKLSLFNSDPANKNWIPESEIKDIAEDKKGNLFVATATGELLAWSSNALTFEHVNKVTSTKRPRLVRMLVSSSGIVWLLDQERLNLYDSKLNQNVDWLLDMDLLNRVGTPRGIAEDRSGNLWIGGSRGLVNIKLQDKTLFKFEWPSLGLPNTSIITVLQNDRNGNLLIGTNNGHLLVWDTTKNAVLESSKLEGNGQFYITKLLEYRDKIIIGTDSGLYVSNEQFSSFDLIEERDNDSSSIDVYSLHLDDKYIWVGKIDGLDILSFPPFELFNMENSGVSNHVISFAEDDTGKIWIGTYSGLYSRNSKDQYHLRTQLYPESSNNSAEDQRILTLSYEDANLWIGLFEGGFKKLNLSTKDSQLPEEIVTNAMAVTKVLVNKKDVWIATFDHGLFRYKDGKSYSYFDNDKLPERSVTALHHTRTGIFLAVSGSRIYSYDFESDSFQKLTFDFGPGTKAPLIYSIAHAVDGNIYFGTKDYGLFVWPRKNQLENTFKVEQSRTESAAVNFTIYGIEIDAEGNLWCSTQSGIVKLRPDGKLIKRFTIADGLQGNDFTLGASYKSHDGLMYFGGTNGYNRFDPNEIEIDNTPSPMRLTAISLPNQDDQSLGDVSDLKFLQLSHKDHFVTFQFSVLDFIDTERNQFRYRLDPFDSDWIENGTNNTATFTNLPAGNYNFRVQGANSAGIWNREGITLSVSVPPPPWFTWWAYTLYVIASLCLMWGLHRIYRSYAIDRRSAEMAMEMFEAENRADDDMQEQLEFQDELVRSAHQHNLTTLNLISESIAVRNVNARMHAKEGSADRSLERIAALSSLESCLSYEEGGAVADLCKYTEGIFPALLEHSPVSPETIITINEVTSTPLPAELASPLSVVIYELLDNCIQHAFLPESPANYISVKLAYVTAHENGATHIELSVRDSGIGICGGIEELALNGRGLAIVQSIASKLGAKLQQSESSGTTIVLKVPGIPGY